MAISRLQINCCSGIKLNSGEKKGPIFRPARADTHKGVTASKSEWDLVVIVTRVGGGFRVVCLGGNLRWTCRTCGL